MIIESFMAGNNSDKLILEPVLVTLERQGLMESVHRGSAIIFHSTEGILAAWGHPEKIIFPRSAMKPLQVFTALSSGLLLSNEQVALGSASHYGEEKHLLIAKKWLSQLSLSAETTWPVDTLFQKKMRISFQSFKNLGINHQVKTLLQNVFIMVVLENIAVNLHFVSTMDGI